jgi:Holliday junction resolvasome RuvABC DNA-binding subunit
VGAEQGFERVPLIPAGEAVEGLGVLPDVVVDPQQRLPVIELVEVGGPAADAAAASSALPDVRAALANLGYGPDEVRRATTGLPSDGEAGDLLRLALRALAD